MRAIVSAAVAFLLAGCASTPAAPDSPARSSGTFQEILVSSDPPGARCIVSQGGNEIATVDPTPGSVTVPRKEAPLKLQCSRAGYFDASGDVDWLAWRESSSPASTPLRAGAVGLGVAGEVGTSAVVAGLSGASVGAVGTAAAAALPIVGIGLLAVLPAVYIAAEVAYPSLSYPGHVSLTLNPSEFPSEEARDAALKLPLRRAEDDVRLRTRGICNLVGETHAQCLREREEEPRRIEEACRSVREGFLAKTKILPQ